VAKVSNTGEKISDIAGIWAKKIANVNMALTCLILIVAVFITFKRGRNIEQARQGMHIDLILILVSGS
jgi:hypothetical protein